MSWHHRHFSLLHCLSLAAVVVISNAFVFLPTTKKAPCVRNSEFSSKFKISMVRNIDLPECLIFYGREALFDFADDGIGATIKAGAEKILKEASDIGTPCILLSEGDISSVELVQKMIDGSSIQNLIQALSTLEVGNDESSAYNQSPSPLALLDALDDITIEPRGFGGSSGFGTKLADPPRSPLPKHWYVCIEYFIMRCCCVILSSDSFKCCFYFWCERKRSVHSCSTGWYESNFYREKFWRL